MSKRGIISAFVILALAAGYAYASPYIALAMLQRAIEQKSAKDVEKFIDFSDVRDSLRSQLSEYIKDYTRGDQGDTGLGRLSAGIGGALGGTLIDLVVQPSNLQDWLSGSGVFEGQSENISISPERLKASYPGITIGYLGPEVFEVRFSNLQPIQSISMERRNLIFWKVNSMGIDMSGLSDSSRLSPPRISAPGNEVFKDGYYFEGGNGFEPDHGILVEGGRVTFDMSYDKFGCSGTDEECGSGSHMRNTVYKSISTSQILRKTPDGKSVVLTWNKGVGE